MFVQVWFLLPLNVSKQSYNKLMTMLVSIDLLSGKFMSGAYLKLNVLKVEKNIKSIKH